MDDQKRIEEEARIHDVSEDAVRMAIWYATILEKSIDAPLD